jgi:hypothetical protein
MVTGEVKGCQGGTIICKSLDLLKPLLTDRAHSDNSTVVSFTFVVHIIFTRVGKRRSPYASAPSSFFGSSSRSKCHPLNNKSSTSSFPW